MLRHFATDLKRWLIVVGLNDACEFKHGKGFGEILLKNGDIYQGEFCKGRRDGSGKLTFSEGENQNQNIVLIFNNMNLLTKCENLFEKVSSFYIVFLFQF